MIDNNETIKKKKRNFWSWSKVFIMKWRFRIEQTRSLFTLLTFALLLAKDYIEFVPFLLELGIWGGILLATIILVGFLTVGYLYDRVLKLWTETTKVRVLRNPYTYVPTPKEETVQMGLWSFTFLSLLKISSEMGIELSAEKLAKELVHKYYSISTSTPNFEAEAEELKEISLAIRKLLLESTKDGKERTEEDAIAEITSQEFL